MESVDITNIPYSIRIYELLKSYQKNNQSWWFKFDNLKHILDCTNYEWYDFKRRVLEPAILVLEELSHNQQSE